MEIKAKQNLKEMKDRDEKFKKRKGQSSSEDVRPKKSFSKSGISGFRPSRFEGRLNRRPFGDASSRPSVEPQHQSRSFSRRSRGPRPMTYPQCPHCGRNHVGEC